MELPMMWKSRERATMQGGNLGCGRFVGTNRRWCDGRWWRGKLNPWFGWLLVFGLDDHDLGGFGGASRSMRWDAEAWQGVGILMVVESVTMGHLGSGRR
ncbi:hypothetical protein C7B71_21165 [Bacillus halotolerans]|nr:hypothetical protein C7B71_21165 [Bacillus halotolerans]